jgi:hypothetical protein
MEKSKLGEKHITNEGYKIEIVEYFGSLNCSIQFEDGHIIKNRQYNDVKKGEIKNPYHPSVCGMGFRGEGSCPIKVNGKMTKLYNMWRAMLVRCYDKTYHETKPTYKDTNVCEEWHNFQNFAKWYEKNFNTETMQDWHLDKDIIYPNCKIYSPETCCFVPCEINSLFTKNDCKRNNYIGVYKSGDKFMSQLRKKYLGTFDTPEEAFQAYKTAKEVRIKEVADKWKGLISDKVYQAMYNYQVEITD